MDWKNTLLCNRTKKQNKQTKKKKKKKKKTLARRIVVELNKHVWPLPYYGLVNINLPYALLWERAKQVCPIHSYGIGQPG